MKEQWIEDISNKMDGYEIDAPELSWSEIEGKVAANRHRAHIVALWKKGMAVAASLLLIIATSTTIFFMEDEQVSTTSNAVATLGAKPNEDAASKPSENIASKSSKEVENNVSMARPYRKNDILASKQVLTSSANNVENGILPSKVEDDTEIRPDAPDDSQTATQSAMPTKQTKTEKKKTSLDYPEEFVANKQPQNTARLMASAYYGNGISNGSSPLSSFDINMQQDASSVAGGDQCVLGSPDEEPRVTARHHQPLRVGLAVKYAINNRWGVETGLAYSYLKSNISEERRAYTTNTEQKMGYVGIPLAASYNITTARALHFYVSAGTMLEIPVVAKAEENIVSNGITTTTQEHNLSKSALQLSLTGRLGAEYNFTPSVGIYVEPGVSYYFDNGSNIETAYSDKPFCLNLNLGVRLTLR